MNIPVEAECLHAALRLVLRLTRNHQNAMLFAELGGPRILLTLTQSSSFPGFISLASLIFRHIIEEPSSLRYCMEKVSNAYLFSICVPLNWNFWIRFNISIFISLWNYKPACFIQLKCSQIVFWIFIMCDINILILHTIDNSNSYTHLTTHPPWTGICRLLLSEFCFPVGDKESYQWDWLQYPRCQAWQYGLQGGQLCVQSPGTSRLQRPWALLWCH